MNIFDGLTKVFAGIITGVAETPCRFLIYSDQQNFNPSTGGWDQAIQSDSGPLSCTPPLQYSENEIDGTRIKDGDFKIIIGFDQWEGLPVAFGLSPRIDMAIQIETDSHVRGDGFKQFTILVVKPFETGKNVAAWEAHCRG